MACSSVRSVLESTGIYDLAAIKIDIREFAVECGHRGLYPTQKWLAELNSSLEIEITSKPPPAIKIDSDKLEDYLLASCLIPLKQHARISNLIKTSDLHSSRASFVKFHSQLRYLEANQPLDFTSLNSITKSTHTCLLRKLDAQLSEYLSTSGNDGFCHYVKGMVQCTLRAEYDAMFHLCKAVNSEPLLWQAWEELASLIDDKAVLMKLKLPDHWMKEFFLATVYVKLQRNDEALKILSDLHENGFSKSHFVLSKIASVYHDRRDINNALIYYRRIHEEDPYRLEDTDTYSHLLYVSDLHTELFTLAHHLFSINRFSVQTCLVVGNYHGLKRDFAKAVNYFHRAIKLKPTCVSALILKGHEYMEMKDNRGAVCSYRDAIAVNPQDYRAWHALGQTYEILSMPSYALYYYKMAQRLIPDDSRMLIAMGEIYEKLGRYDDAIRTYKRARNVGDVYSFALTRLARLFSEMKIDKEAVIAYQDLVKELEDFPYSKELPEAYRYLAYCYLKNNQLQLAFDFAQLCLNYEETKEEGKAVLKEIAIRRETELAENQESNDVFDE